VTNLYVNTTLLSGDHLLRLVGPQAVNKDFTFMK